MADSSYRNSGIRACRHTSAHSDSDAIKKNNNKKQQINTELRRERRKKKGRKKGKRERNIS